MLMAIVNAVCQKVGEYAAILGLDCFKSAKDFDHNLEILQVKLGSLSIKAADVDKELENLELSGKKKRKGEVDQWLAEVESIKVKVDELKKRAESEGCIVRFFKGEEAAQLNEQVEKLLQQPSGFGELVLDVGGPRGDPLPTEEMVGEAFNQNFETILEVLENGQVSRIGVYGMGGVGKTTLAKHIYNRLVQEYEGRVVWVTVSHEFTIKSLQEKIAHFMGVELEDEDEEAFRAVRLRSFLSDKKISVLILDDVWRNIDMREVGCDLDGCRLLITTRSLGVCRQIGCKKLISVVKLCKDEAWKLFNGTLENEAELDPQVEEIAKSMTMLCGGLPLGIITVAGSMKGETAVHMWRNALAELEECVRGQDETGEVEEVFKVLKYSFDRLKRNHGSESNGFNVIQHCFLHYSLFPEDFEISRDDLVKEFISDGLLDERRSRREQFEQGHSILDKLVNLCLLESCVNYMNIECVKMHDLVRSMALRICKGKYMVRVGDMSLEEIHNEEEWTKDLEKVSLINCYNLVCIREGISPDCPKLSTLLVWWNMKLQVIPESFFSKMQGLCTLDMGGNHNIAMLPNSIRDLTCLKSLQLEDCKKLEKVPYLGKMKALRELNLSGTAIKEAPQGLEELLNLRFLSIYAPGLMMLPRGLLLKLVHLEHLSIPLHVQVSTEEIEKLKRLEEFSGGVKSVSDFNKFVRSRAYGPCYRILVSKNVVGAAKLDIRWPKAPNNNELELHKCNLKDEKVLGKGVVELTMRGCEGVSKWLVDDLLERFDNPTSLRILQVSRCGGIEWIMRSDGQGLSSTLEEIKLEVLDDLIGVVMVMESERGGIGIVAATAQPPVFSSLQIFIIFGCKKMRKLGLPVSALPNLEEISICDCEEVEEIFQEDEGIAAASTLPKLKYMVLEDLPRLKRLSKATIISNSIQYINIRKCPRLMNKLPLHFDDPAPPPSLDYIGVDRGWWESLEWDNHLLPQLLHPFLHFPR